MHRASDLRGRLGKWAAVASIAAASVGGAACADKEPPPNPPCERKCQDGVALRAIREMMKFAFNMTLQMQPVGYNDLTTDKFLRGTARVFGNAYANSEQGVTDVDLTYVFTQAVYAKKQDDPEQNYIMGLDGIITQTGKMAVQPSSPTSLKMHSESLTLAGKVYDPPIDYLDMGHNLVMLQNGNSVSGVFCDRDDSGPSLDGGANPDGDANPEGGPGVEGGRTVEGDRSLDGGADLDGGVSWDGGPIPAGCRLVGFSF
jgi:hypothetical protein